MLFYTYYSYEPWGRGYIGCKPSGSKDPENDGYFGTFKDKSFKPTQKIILGVYNTPEECIDAEILLHAFFEVDVNPHFANKAKQKSTGFSFSASGELNPNFGGNNYSEAGRQKMSDTVTKTNQKYGNPFAKKGSESQAYGRQWVTNSDKSEEIYLKKGESIPDGWTPGRKKRPPRSQESRDRTSRALKGKRKSEEHKRNLSIAITNHYKSQKEQ